MEAPVTQSSGHPLTAALEAQKKFRRIRGHHQMPRLLEALKRIVRPQDVDIEKAVA